MVLFCILTLLKISPHTEIFPEVLYFVFVSYHETKKYALVVFAINNHLPFVYEHIT